MAMTGLFKGTSWAGTGELGVGDCELESWRWRAGQGAGVMVTSGCTVKQGRDCW